MEHIQQSCMHVPQVSGQSLHAESSELARKSSGNRAVFQAFVTPPGLILWQRLKPPRPTPLRELSSGTLQAIQALRSVVMQLAPHTASSREPARRAETNVHRRAGGGARAPFTTDEQMPIVAALAGEIVEGHLDNRGPSEQFQIAFTDGLPTKPDAAHRVVHAGCVPRLPVRRESIKVARIESSVKIDQ